jgi:hypothetical protein
MKDIIYLLMPEEWTGGLIWLASVSLLVVSVLIYIIATIQPTTQNNLKQL